MLEHGMGALPLSYYIYTTTRSLFQTMLRQPLFHIHILLLNINSRYGPPYHMWVGKWMKKYLTFCLFENSRNAPRDMALLGKFDHFAITVCAKNKYPELIGHDFHKLYLAKDIVCRQLLVFRFLSLAFRAIPVLCFLFLNLAFSRWLSQNLKKTGYERYLSLC